jgi:hypothetical protein
MLTSRDPREEIMLRVPAAAGLVILAFSSASAQTPTIDQLPAALKPQGQAVYLEVPATGVQIYTCGRNPAGAFAWNFKGPEAELFDTRKQSIGKHYGGPTWEGKDGGKIMASVKANAAAPKQGAIPWLLLETKTPSGSGQFAQAKAILRVSTEGGVAPSQPCTEAQNGQESRVPYTATYLFLK